MGQRWEGARPDSLGDRGDGKGLKCLEIDFSQSSQSTRSRVGYSLCGRRASVRGKEAFYAFHFCHYLQDGCVLPGDENVY
jgi:hypothetical protein